MDAISYLNNQPEVPGYSSANVLVSRLQQIIRESGQGRAGAAQWAATIRSMSQKGVKQAEVDDSGVMLWLQGKKPDEKITKQEILKRLSQQSSTIKRIDLGRPRYANYQSVEGGKYTERLYVLSSEAMVADDELQDLLFQIEELGFNPGPLLEVPKMIDRLEARMADLRQIRPTLYDFPTHHYSEQVKEHGKNLLAHSRFNRQPDGTFFIQEIQSDWAQQGRISNWSVQYPRAPFVTNTELWAGMVTRDLLHSAANDANCKQVAWVNSSMRNGFQHGHEADDLAVFYDTIIRKLVDKLIAKSGGEVKVLQVRTKDGRLTEVRGFEMTDAVRNALKGPQPLYSRDNLLPRGAQLEDPQREAERRLVVAECKKMLGSARDLRFVSRLYDLATGSDVAGQYVNGGITISLRAGKLDRAARHEAWHFAHENLLFDHERRQMRMDFSPGAPLNDRTREVLQRMGMHSAAEQCKDHRECAAHAFSLWAEGELELTENPTTLFGQVQKSLDAISNWISENVFGVEVKSPEDLFSAFRTGALLAREALVRESELFAEEEGAAAPRG